MQRIFMNKKRCAAAAVCLALMIAAGMPAGVKAAAVDVQLPTSGGAVSGPLLADTITASSTLEDGSGFNYSADCLQDYNSNTARRLLSALRAVPAGKLCFWIPTRIPSWEMRKKDTFSGLMSPSFRKTGS